MKSIEIILTSKCNARCSYCYSPVNQMTREFSGDAVEKILAWGKKAGVESVYFGGGEPTVMDNLSRFVLSAKRMEYKVMRLLTNGMRLKDEPYLKNLTLSGINEIEISVSGCEPQTVDKLMGMDGAFAAQTRGIRNVIKNEIKLECAVLITSVNYKYLTDIIKFYSGMGVKKFSFWFFSLFGLNKNDSAYLLPAISDVMPYVIESMTAGVELKCEVRSMHIPLCIFPEEYRAFILNARDMDLIVIEPSGKFKVEDSPFEGGVKVHECLQCCEEKRCLGLREDYLEIHGEREVKAIKQRWKPTTRHVNPAGVSHDEYFATEKRQ